MNEFGSKTCYNCYSAQHLASRFCDNCGNRFVAEVTVVGTDSFSESKTFMRRQVAETRPLFWASILIVGTLSVFGFAQAGVFSGTINGYMSPVAVPPALIVSKDEPKMGSETALETKDVTSSSDPLLDLNASVFDMKHESTTALSAPKRRLAGSSSQPAPVRPNVAEKIAQDPEPLQKPIEEPPARSLEPAEKKTAEPAAPAPRAYVRGPMGGCYYLTASGGKRYVDRSVCK